MECPRCRSSDVTRSRRKFWERIALYFLRGQVFRCRDCKKRFWVDVEWGKVILGTLTAVVVTSAIVAIVAVHRNQEPRADAPPRIPAQKRRRLPPLPRGLPRLSSVPLPGPGTGAAQDEKGKSISEPKP
jgi:hypothetical protein